MGEANKRGSFLERQKLAIERDERKAAKAACQAHHEAQVLALLEQVEGGQ